MQNNTKSSVTAGLLGIFLGAFGGHDWYLGNTKKAIAHVSLCAGGAILLMIGLILTSLSKGVVVLNILFMLLIVMAYIVIVGNAVWGFIEGIIIIAQGDSGLAAKGYTVATPVEATAPMTLATPVAGEATAQELKDATANANTDPVPTATISTPPVSSFTQPTTNTTTTTPEAPAQPATDSAPTTPTTTETATPAAPNTESTPAASEPTKPAEAPATTDTTPATTPTTAPATEPAAPASTPEAKPAETPTTPTTAPEAPATTDKPAEPTTPPATPAA